VERPSNQKQELALKVHPKCGGVGGGGGGMGGRGGGGGKGGGAGGGGGLQGVILGGCQYPPKG